MDNPIIRGEPEKACSTAVRPGSGSIQCPCLCSFFIPKRPNQKFATDKCRYRFRDRQRYERQKKAVELAKELKTLSEKAKALADSVLEPKEGKR